MAVVHVTSENFLSEVMESDRPVLIDFWASWCGPCKMLAPTIDALAAERTDVKVCKVDVDEEMALAEKFQVMSIPTLVVVKDGKVVNQTVGVQPKEAICKLLEA